jgi:hypothetical protein
MTKHTYVLFGGAAMLALVLSPQRRHLASRHFWTGVLIAIILLLPNIIWQFQHDFPSIEFYRNAMLRKNIPTPPLDVIGGQILSMNPLTLPIWLAGAWYLLFHAVGKRFRLLGFMFVILFIVLVASQASRPDRISGIYTVALAGGAVLLGRLIESRRQWIGTAVAAVLVAGAIALAPLAIPLLSPETTTNFAAATGLIKPIERGAGKATVLPQLLADRIGWEHFAREMADALQSIPPQERAHASIFVIDYGHAGMLELRKEEYGFPDVFSPHNSYWMWGRDQTMGSTVLALVLDPSGLKRSFGDVRHLKQIETPFAMPWRANMGVFIAREPSVDLRAAWEAARHYE